MEPYCILLGVAQDGGYPQVGCQQPCCKPGWNGMRRLPVCLGIVDPRSQQQWLLDCTPAFPDQFYALCLQSAIQSLHGIFLTHAHMGHYTGLIYLGPEAMNGKKVSVHVMPRMRDLLTGHAPWSHLVQREHIQLHSLQAEMPFPLNERISVTPIPVPHRGELSETVAFRITGPKRSVLYLPDIDGWDQWSLPIEAILKEVDVAYLDGTFYSPLELPGRDLTKIPHPTIRESVQRFARLRQAEREKVRFLHFNHSNPVLHSDSEEAGRVKDASHFISCEGERSFL